MATALPRSTLPSIFEHFPRPATTASATTERRIRGLWVGLVAIAAGTGIAAATGSRTRGIATGGLAAVALGALRWQLGRWFVANPAYVVEDRFGSLEIRRYPVRIEARAAVDDHQFEAALDRGYGRLACYVYGANARREDLARTTPVLVAMHGGAYSTAFIMPPGRDRGSLPRPDDARVELREVPAGRVAVLAFRGRMTRSAAERYERELLRELVDAGLSTRGSVVFAIYDSPATLPLLRRNELWIELV